MFSGGTKVGWWECVLLQQQTVVPYLSLGVIVLLFSIGAMEVVLTCCDNHILLSYRGCTLRQCKGVVGPFIASTLEINSGFFRFFIIIISFRSFQREMENVSCVLVSKGCILLGLIFE